MHKKVIQSWLKHIDFILLDELSLLCVLIATISYPSPIDNGSGDVNPFGFIMLVVEINLLLIIASDLFSTVIHNDDFTEFKITFRHTFQLLSFTLLALAIRNGRIIYPVSTLLLCFILYFLLSYVTRILWRWFLLLHKRSPEKQKAVLVVTHEKDAQAILDRLKKYAFGGYAANGVVLIDRDAEGEQIGDVPVVANIANAADYLCKSWTDEVLFFRSSLDERVQRLIESCSEMAVTLHFYVPLQGVGENKRTIERIAGYDVLTANLNVMAPYDAFLKRVLDILIGLIGSFTALIVLAIVGPIIKKASPGPLLFKQVRIGENGKRFQMYKIRSMYVDAEKRKTELKNMNSHKDGMLFKINFDPRVIGNELLPDGTQKTGIGDFIRRTSLDELPQFFNVLRGEMSVVGTRPPTVDEWEKYKYHHRARMSIRPGVTGLWQIDPQKDYMSFEDVVRLDTNYISSWSMGKDMRIIFHTVANMFSRVKR